MLDFLFNFSKVTRKIIIWFFSHLEGGVYRSSTIRKLYKKNRSIDAGYLSYGFTSDGIEGPITIGKYTSIGKNVRRIDVNHYTNYATTHPCVFNPIFGWVSQDKRQKSELYIGNDVWIGDNVIILPSVHSIGNGAIIAAGAVVTKDIPPYEIWGGAAAHFLKRRFPLDLIERLEKVQWWNSPEERLKELKDYFANPEELVKILESEKVKDISDTPQN